MLQIDSSHLANNRITVNITIENFFVFKMAVLTGV